MENGNAQKKLEKERIVAITAHTTVLSNFGPEAQILTCPYCGHFVSTIVKPTAGLKTHLVAALMCACCCWLCACCPYVNDACMNRTHYCGNCKSYLGQYRF